jgi:hypothetical protein
MSERAVLWTISGLGVLEIGVVPVLAPWPVLRWTLFVVGVQRRRADLLPGGRGRDGRPDTRHHHGGALSAEDPEATVALLRTWVTGADR